MGSLLPSQTWLISPELLRLATALIRYWFNRGALLQGQQVIEEAIARPGIEQHRLLYAVGLMNSGRLFAFRGLDRKAAAQYERAIEIARQCGALAVVVESLGRLGYALIGLDDKPGARAALEEARDLARNLPGDQLRPRTVAVSNLAELERLEGRFEIAARLYEETLTLNVSLGDRQATMIALNNLAMTGLALGNMTATRQRLLESLAICEELDSRRGRLAAASAPSGALPSDTPGSPQLERARHLGQSHRAEGAAVALERVRRAAKALDRRPSPGTSVAAMKP